MLKKKPSTLKLDIFKEIASGINRDTDQQKMDGELVWEENPVDIETFICDKRFLNQKWNGRTGCRPKILEIAKEVVKPEKREIMLVLGKGSGKDYISSILHLYGIYTALCLYDPQSYYGLAAGSPIYFVNVARNERQSKKVFFTQFTGLLEQCLWFKDKYEEPSMDEVRFNKRIFALSGNSQAHGWLGYNTLQWVGDELAFFLENDENEEESDSKAEDCWEAAYGSCQSRFPNSYKMIGITSPRYDDDFTMRKFFELQNRPDGYSIRAATWDINPALTIESFKYALARNYRRTMRDFGAEPMGVVESFWSDPDFVEENVCEKCRQCKVYQDRKQNTNIYDCLDYEYCQANAYHGNGNWAEWFTPDKEHNEYCMHFDLSKNKDRLGFSLGHVVDIIRIELDQFQLQEKLENEKLDKNNMDDEDKYVEKPLIKLDAVGWIDPRSRRDNKMIKNNEIYYQSILTEIILKLKDNGFNIVKITFDQFQCLTGNTYIPTDRGLIHLRDVRVGDAVPTRTGKKQYVVAKYKYENTPTIKIITESGNVLCGTPNHRIEVLDFYNHKCGNKNIKGWVWKRFDELSTSDIVRTSDEYFANQVGVVKYRKMKQINLSSFLHEHKNISNSTINNMRFPEFCDEDFAEFLGIIWGDGSFIRNKFGHTNGLGISCGTNEEVKFVIQKFISVFNVEPFIHHGNSVGKGVGITNLLLGCFFEVNELVKLPYDKKLKIPEIILKSPKSVVGAFLRGLFSTDGTVDKNDGASILVSTSLSLIRQVKYILESLFGLRSAICSVKNDGSDSCFGVYTWKHQLRVSGSRNTFFEKIGYCYRSKHEKLKQHLFRNGRKKYEHISKIKFSGKKDVYDLTVSGDHSYVANGIVSHNSHYLKQKLADLGFETDLLSCDRTDEVPVQAKQAFVENRVYYPYVRVLCEESKHLKYIKGKKVDHDSRNTKDVWDSTAGTIYNCEHCCSMGGNFEDLTNNDGD